MKPYKQPGNFIVHGPGLPTWGAVAIGAEDMNIAFNEGRKFERKKRRKK